MNKTICVLGGTGFIGKSLLLKLAQSGYHIRLVTRYKHRHMSLENYHNVQLVAANLHKKNDIAALFDGCSTLINLIGIINNGKGNSTYKKVHVDIVRTIISAIKHTDIKRIIQVSALHADYSMASSSFLQTKGEAENILKVQTNTQANVTVLRPSLVFGKNGGFVSSLAQLLKTHRILPLPCPNSSVAPIYVDDVAHAICACIDDYRTFGKKYDLCGREIYSVQQVTQIIQNAQMSNAKIIPLSDFSSKLLARLPGKLFTTEKYAVLQYPVKTTEHIEFLPNLTLKSFESWAKESLEPKQSRQKYFKFRQQASR